MSDGKIFPMTENRRKSLRQKGITPYSPASIRAGTLALLCMLGGTLYKKIMLYLHSPDSTVLHDSIATIDFFYHIISYTMLIACMGVCCFIIMGGIQTSFLVLPFRKYPEGVYIKTQKKSLKSLLKTFALLSITAAILGKLVFSFLSDFNTTFTSLVHQIELIHVLYLFRILPIDTILYASGVFLLFTALLVHIHTRATFLERNKMTRGELFEEMNDS
jgi:flagellar biosynthesis protein FlhB